MTPQLSGVYREANWHSWIIQVGLGIQPVEVSDGGINYVYSIGEASNILKFKVSGDKMIQYHVPRLVYTSIQISLSNYRINRKYNSRWLSDVIRNQHDLHRRTMVLSAWHIRIFPLVSLPRSMMTSSNWNIFGVTGHLCGESPVNSPHTVQWRGALMFPLICAWINGWVNNDEAGDSRHHPAHYDVTVM